METGGDFPPGLALPGIPSGGFISRIRISRLKLLPNRSSALRAIRSPDGRLDRTRSRLLCPSWDRIPRRRSSAGPTEFSPNGPPGGARSYHHAPRTQLPKRLARNLSVETGLAPSRSAARSRAKPHEIWSKARFWPRSVNFETMDFAICCLDQLLFAII